MSTVSSLHSSSASPFHASTHASGGRDSFATQNMDFNTVSIKATSNQIVLGTTNTVTLTSAAPAASRILTIPDPGGDASLLVSVGNQTLTGTLTLNPSSGVAVNYTMPSSTTAAFTTQVAADTQVRSSYDTDGQLGWGPGGSTARDIWLYRNGTNTLTLSQSSRGNGNGKLNIGYIAGNTTGFVLQISDWTSNTMTSASSTGTFVSSRNSTMSPNSGAIDNTIISSTSGTLGGTTTSYCSLLATNGCSISGNGNQKAIIASNAATMSGSGSNNAIIAASGTISSSNTYNTMMSGGGTMSGNTRYSTMVNSQGDSTINDCLQCFGSGSSYNMQTRRGVTMFSDADSTTSVTFGADNIFQARFSNGYYLTTNSLNSVGVSVGAGQNTWGTISDGRLKDLYNEIPYDTVYDNLERVPVYNYKYKCDEQGKIRLGVVAQDVNNIFHKELGIIEKNICIAHCANTEEEFCDDPVQIVNPSDLTYLLLAGFRKMKAKVETLESTVATLTTENANLTNQLVSQPIVAPVLPKEELVQPQIDMSNIPTMESAKVVSANFSGPALARVNFVFDKVGRITAMRIREFKGTAEQKNKFFTIAAPLPESLRPVVGNHSGTLTYPIVVIDSTSEYVSGVVEITSDGNVKIVKMGGAEWDVGDICGWKETVISYTSQ